MTVKGHFHITWVASLLLLLALVTSLGHVHSDDMSAEICAICAFNDQADTPTTCAYQPLSAGISADSQPVCNNNIHQRIVASYFSRAPPLV